MGTRLYVGNIPFSADEHQLRELFEQNDRRVEEVRILLAVTPLAVAERVDPKMQEHGEFHPLPSHLRRSGSR